MVNHIAFIMDGNRRYGKKIFKNPFKGHNKGGDKVYDIILYGLKKNIKNMSFYVFSNENWNREKTELSLLLNNLLSFLDKLINNDIYFQNIEKRYNKFGFSLKEIKFKFISSNTKLNNKYFQKFNIIENMHKKNNKKININFFISYSSREDIINTIKKIKNKKLINEGNFSDFLSTKTIPNPEIVIRTGGYQRLSNFLLFESAYSELFFTKKLWPELKERDISKIIKKFKKIKRNFGK
jgi:undecaprenyl diphosphate synthase